jgi:peptidoglycan/xylan/chitin deacetylase (PgdA/CDA1 family)
MIYSGLKTLLPRHLVVQRLRSRAPGVLLTFDDGPHREVTPGVLERLDSYHAKAVFFVIGQRIQDAPQVLEQVRAGGHLVGNHSFLHEDHYVRAGERRVKCAEYYQDIKRCQTVIRRYTGQQPFLFRPPGGRLTPVTLLVPTVLGLRCVTWSQETGDWRFRSAREARLGAVALANAINPRDILLLHDDNPYVLDLLDSLLPKLAQRRMDLASGVEYL